MAIIRFLNQLEIDHGAMKNLPAALGQLGVKKPLICTDKGLVQVGIVEKARQVLGNEIPHEIYDGTPENPTEEAVLEALAMYKESGCDGIVCLGGGSSMDLGKAVGVLVDQPGPLPQYALAEGGRDKIKSIPPLIAIPTTSGTGSEISPGFVVIVKDGRKLTFASPLGIPQIALCDPDLTFGLPARLTAATGMDAVTHCIEAFLSPAINPPAEACGLDGLRKAVRQGFLEKAVADGNDKDARWNMMMASSEGAMAFQKGLGAVHSMSHACGRIKELKLHHGTLNAVILPSVLRFNKDHVGDKYALLREAMGLGTNADLADEITKLNQRIGLPANLGEMGITMETPGIIENSVADICSFTNPRPVSPESYEELFKDAIG
jgi:alcohol dehydrogenase class IV